MSNPLTTFRDTLHFRAPPRLRRFFGSRLLYAFGVHMDAFGDAVVAGVKARFPNLYTNETLGIIGRERGIRRGPAETDTGYAARLENWFETHRRRANPYSLMRLLQAHLTPHLVPMAVVNNSGCWYTMASDGTPGYHATSAWNWDGNTARWSRYWLILYPPNTLWQPTDQWGAGDNWGNNTFGNPDTQVTWGSTAHRDEVDQIRTLVAEWQAPHSRCQNIIVAWNDSVFDPAQTAPPLPDGTWHNYAKIVAGSYVRSRDPSAIYWAVTPEVSKD